MANITELIEHRLEIFYSKHVLSLIIISIIGLFLRLYFTRFDFPLESQDAFIYLLQAQQLTQGKFDAIPVTYGWQAFLSFFFMPFNFENNLGYMAIQRLVSISVSIATIPVVYILGKKVIEKRYAIVAAAFFAFDPNLIENSIFGITEPLFLFCGTLSIYFALLGKTKYLMLAAIFAGFSIDIRPNGIVLFIILTIISLTTMVSKEEKIKNCLLFLGFFAIAAAPFFIATQQQSGNPFGSFFSLTQAVQDQAAPSLAASDLDSGFSGKLRIAVTNEFMHIFRIAIPYLALFVPFGIISSLSSLDYNKKIILLTITVSLIVAVPQYTLSLEYRNLFLILPMFAVIAALGIQYILSSNSRKNLFLFLLIAGIILLSYNMLRERNDIDLDLLKEKERFGQYVATSFKGKMMGDLYTQIAHSLPQARLSTVPGEQLRNDNIVLVGFGPPTKTVSDLMKYARDNGITHIVIDDVYEQRSPEFVEVFYNEAKYPYLKKLFDSEEHGYRKLNVKIFEIDYNNLE